MESFFFYLLSAAAIASALVVVLARNPLYNVLALVSVIFCISSLCVLLEAFFVGIILLLVYAGAVMVFFIFVVMCLNMTSVELKTSIHSRFRLLGSVVVLAFVSSLGLATRALMDATALPASDIRGTIENIGKILFTDYLLPFELTSLLLLVAVFGIVSLAQGVLATGKREASS